VGDDALRNAERAWRASGSDEDSARYLAEKVRTGLPDLTLRTVRLALAAASGKPPSEGMVARFLDDDPVTIAREVPSRGEMGPRGEQGEQGPPGGLWFAEGGSEHRVTRITLGPGLVGEVQGDVLIVAVPQQPERRNQAEGLLRTAVEAARVGYGGPVDAAGVGQDSRGRPVVPGFVVRWAEDGSERRVEQVGLPPDPSWGGLDTRCRAVRLEGVEKLVSELRIDVL